MIGDTYDIPVGALTTEGKFAFFDQVNYDPHVGQRRLHNSDKRFRVVSAGARAGKTTAAAYEAIAYAHLPNKVIWCVAPTYDLSEKVFRIIWRVMVEERGYETISKSYRDRFILFKWGTEVRGRSCQNPESLLGEGVDFMIIDEASRLQEVIWNEYLNERLMDKIGYVLMISTPHGTHGIFPKLHKRGKQKHFPDWWSDRIPLYENPKIRKSEIQRLKRESPKEAFDQEVLGKFVPYGGLVFKEWDTDKHVSDRAAFRPDAPIMFGIDYGIRNPTAVLLCQKVGEHLLNVFGEYYDVGLDTVDHSIAVRKAHVLPLLKESIHETIHAYHDPAGADQSSIFKKFNPELVMIPGVNDIEPGIDTVRYYLKDDPNKDRPRLLIHPDCTNLIWEMEQYHYPKRSERKRTAITELPVDVDNHALAGLRYLLHTIDPAGSMVVDLSQLDNEFSEETLGVQEVGRGYYEEISTLKGAYSAETRGEETDIDEDDWSF